MSWFGAVCSCGRFQLILAIGEFAVLLWEASLFCAMSYISQYGSFCDLPFPFNDVRSPNIGRHSVLLLECWCWSSSDPKSCLVSCGDKGRWTCGSDSGKDRSRGWQMGSSVIKFRPLCPSAIFTSLLLTFFSTACSSEFLLPGWVAEVFVLSVGLSNCSRVGPGETASSWASDGFMF